MQKGLVTDAEIQATFKKVSISSSQESGVRPETRSSDENSSGDKQLRIPLMPGDSGPGPSETGNTGTEGQVVAHP